jgi:hypothetical protein
LGTLAVIALLACYDAAEGDPEPVAMTVPSLDGPCSRYSYLTVPGMKLRLDSNQGCEECGTYQVEAPDRHGYKVLTPHLEGTTLAYWRCDNGVVGLRRVFYGDGPDAEDVDIYSPPIVRWIDGLAPGDTWTTDYRVTQIRGGEITDFERITRSYLVEEGELLELAGGAFETLLVTNQESGERRWIADGYGVVRKDNPTGFRDLTKVTWPLNKGR